MIMPYFNYAAIFSCQMNLILTHISSVNTEIEGVHKGDLFSNLKRELFACEHDLPIQTE